MVQKSQGQPPGMVLKHVINNGINYTFPSTGAGFLLSTGVVGKLNVREVLVKMPGTFRFRNKKGQSAQIVLKG